MNNAQMRSELEKGMPAMTLDEEIAVRERTIALLTQMIAKKRAQLTARRAYDRKLAADAATEVEISMADLIPNYHRLK